MAGILALAAIVTWHAWPDDGRVNEPAAPVESVLSLAEARQRDILKQSVGRPGHARLMRQYREINERHFAGRLPELPVVWEPRLAEVGQLSAQAFTLEGMFGYVNKQASILLNPNLQSDEAALLRALCHEMVHAYLYTVGDRTSDHGPAFRGELARLSAEGAITGLVATEVERRSLRTWLDAEAARLDAESAAAKREGDELDVERAALAAAMNTATVRVMTAGSDELERRRDAYNQRAMDANRRLEQARTNVAEFNRQAARYNLMMSYPDGIDGADLVPTRTGTFVP